ncbi:MAG: NAD-dependent epimerase/dehydratase family protein [Gammaproteobacteria bacterium]
MAKRVLLVGCQGFVGRHVLQALRAAGWSVYGYDLAADCTDDRLEHYFCGQLQDRACLAALAQTKADLIVSLAAYNAGDGMVSSVNRTTIRRSRSMRWA